MPKSISCSKMSTSGHPARQGGPEWAEAEGRLSQSVRPSRASSESTLRPERMQCSTSDARRPAVLLASRRPSGVCCCWKGRRPKAPATGPSGPAVGEGATGGRRSGAVDGSQRTPSAFRHGDVETAEMKSFSTLGSASRAASRGALAGPRGICTVALPSRPRAGPGTAVAMGVRPWSRCRRPRPRRARGRPAGRAMERDGHAMPRMVPGEDSNFHARGAGTETSASTNSATWARHAGRRA